MDSLHDAMMKRMERVGLEKALSATFILEAANRVLPQQFRAKTFRNGVLTLEANVAAHAYIYKQEEETFLEQINAALPEKIVEKLRLRVVPK